jgi:hypothetical protein
LSSGGRTHPYHQNTPCCWKNGDEDLEKSGGRSIPECGSGSRAELEAVVRRKTAGDFIVVDARAKRDINRGVVMIAWIKARAGVLTGAADQIFMNAIEDLMGLRASRAMVRAAAEQSLIGFLAHAEGPGQDAE